MKTELTVAQIASEARKYCVIVPGDGITTSSKYDITKYDCREDFISCVLACVKLSAGLADAKICAHETTHRGVAIWTICDDCGAKWADEKSARAQIASQPATKEQQ